jgi:hypothetical protein
VAAVVIATASVATACASPDADVAIRWTRAIPDRDGHHVWVIYRSPCAVGERAEIWYRTTSVEISLRGRERRPCTQPIAGRLWVPLHEPLGSRAIVGAGSRVRG